MPCYAPVRLKNPLYYNKDPAAHKARAARVRGSNRGIYEMIHGVSQFIDVPCGKCYGCMRMRVNGWVFRHLLELSVSPTAHFVTLTYSNENVPISDKGEFVFDKREVQKFFKRLRKYLSSYYPDAKVKYHIASEYGDTFQRPHYHILLYGYPNEPSALDKIPELWKKGHVDIGTVTEKSIRYVVEYITQYYYNENWDDPDAKPFALYSNSLGADSYVLVARYLRQTKKNLYPINGKYYRVPNSYLLALREKGHLTPRELETIKENSYEYYQNLKLRQTDFAVSRGINPFVDEITKFQQGSLSNERKYKQRKQGV